MTVHVRCGLAASAMTEMIFAADLAAWLRSRLLVWIDADAAIGGLLASTVSDAQARERTTLRRHIIDALGGHVPAGGIEFAHGDPVASAQAVDDLLIGTRFAREARRHSTIASMEERALEARGAGEVCLPFGNGESGRYAGSIALPLIAALGLPVLFYHTTYKEPGVSEDAPPEQHMVEGARAVQAELAAKAESLGLKHRTIVETAGDLVEGIGKIALAEHCLMIAMARGRNTGRGSYVDGVLRRSPVPVFVAGRRE